MVVLSSRIEIRDAAGSFGSLLIPALTVVSLRSVGTLLWSNWGTVFISNDDVASWDRWAEDWYLNRRRYRAFLSGCAVCGFLFLEYLGLDFLITGNVDCALAFYCFLSFYAIYTADKSPGQREPRHTAVFFAAGATLTKQGGLLALTAILLYLACCILKRANLPKAGVGPRASVGLRLSA